jgi:DNA-binding NarL/FixJ family response regulator
VVVISDVLGVATGSVKAHVAASLERLNASNRTEAVMLLRELEMDEDPQ